MNKTTTILAIAASFVPLLDATAQLDRNRTFYHRNDGGVTVVDPDKNFFGESEIKVRRYGNADAAYQSEYALELGLVELGLQLLVEGGKAASEWWEQREARIQSENAAEIEALRREEEARVDNRLRSLFVSQEFFETLVGVELYRGKIEGRFIEPRERVKTKRIGFSYITVFDKDDAGNVYTLASITQSSHPALQPGDQIIACDSLLFYPGFEIGAVMNVRNPNAREHTLAVIRSGELFDVTVPARTYEESGEDIAQLNFRLAAEAVYQRALLTASGIQKRAWIDQEESDILRGLGIAERAATSSIVGTWQQDAFSGDDWSTLGRFIVSESAGRISMKTSAAAENTVIPSELRDVSISGGVWKFRSHWPEFGWADFKLNASTNGEFVGWSFYNGNAVDLNRWKLIR